MSWCKQAWEEASPYFEKIKNLDFIKELIDGSLENEKFKFYINQDSIYLEEYGRILSSIASKLTKSTHRSAFLRFASDTINVEEALHAKFKFSDEDNIASPTCLLYTSYLHKQVCLESVEIAIAASLPCFMIYKEIGDYIFRNQSAEKNPYQDWIDTYASEEFNLAVKQAMDIINSLAKDVNTATYNKMTDAFVQACKLEWMFWDSAYKQEKWPL